MRSSNYPASHYFNVIPTIYIELDQALFVLVVFTYVPVGGQNIVLSLPRRVDIRVPGVFNFSPIVAKLVADCARSKLLHARHHNLTFLLYGDDAPSAYALKCAA